MDKPDSRTKLNNKSIKVINETAVKICNKTVYKITKKVETCGSVCKNPQQLLIFFLNFRGDVVLLIATLTHKATNCKQLTRIFLFFLFLIY